MKDEKTYEEINKKIEEGNAVVLTKEEFLKLVEEKGVKVAAKEVDVVTTGTFGPMCSSGAFLNFGHTKPRMKMGGGTVLLNGVPAYTGIAAVDTYIGATAVPANDPANMIFPGEFKYGGGHVIHDLVSGKDILLEAKAYGTNCYPRKTLETWINIKDINEAILCNPRNAYQNYNCAVNPSNKTVYTYMGVLKPNLGNANYCSAAQLSPLLNDPLYKTIGIGTRIFLGGGIGYVYWNGTQHNPNVNRGPNGVPRGGAGTLAVVGDLKQMSPDWLIGVSFLGYGATLAVGIGIPIPILNEDIAKFVSVKDEDIYCQVVDYSESYPQFIPGSLCEVNYKELKSGEVTIRGKKVPTSSLSSYPKARKITHLLKKMIENKKFMLGKAVQLLPSAGSDYTCKPLKERPVNKR